MPNTIHMFLIFDNKFSVCGLALYIIKHVQIVGNNNALICCEGTTGKVDISVFRSVDLA